MDTFIQSKGALLVNTYGQCLFWKMHDECYNHRFNVGVCYYV